MIEKYYTIRLKIYFYITNFLNFSDSQSAKEVGDDENKLKSVNKLRTVDFAGLFHNFQLELVLFSNNNDRGKLKQEICLRLYAVNKNNAKERFLILPLNTLPWLRAQMADMLAKHDGTEQIEKEAPAEIPHKFLQ